MLILIILTTYKLINNKTTNNKILIKIIIKHYLIHLLYLILKRLNKMTNNQKEVKATTLKIKIVIQLQIIYR